MSRRNLSTMSRLRCQRCRRKSAGPMCQRCPRLTHPRHRQAPPSRSGGGVFHLRRPSPNPRRTHKTRIIRVKRASMATCRLYRTPQVDGSVLPHHRGVAVRLGNGEQRGCTTYWHITGRAGPGVRRLAHGGVDGTGGHPEQHHWELERRTSLVQRSHAKRHPEYHAIETAAWPHHCSGQVCRYVARGVALQRHGPCSVRTDLGRWVQFAEPVGRLLSVGDSAPGRRRRQPRRLDRPKQER